MKGTTNKCMSIIVIDDALKAVLVSRAAFEDEDIQKWQEVNVQSEAW
jgi:hypothetical protein